jgi:hypothetical protein
MSEIRTGRQVTRSGWVLESKGGFIRRLNKKTETGAKGVGGLLTDVRDSPLESIPVFR